MIVALAALIPMTCSILTTGKAQSLNDVFAVRCTVSHLGWLLQLCLILHLEMPITPNFHCHQRHGLQHYYCRAPEFALDQAEVLCDLGLLGSEILASNASYEAFICMYPVESKIIVLFQYKIYSLSNGYCPKRRKLIMWHVTNRVSATTPRTGSREESVF